MAHLVALITDREIADDLVAAAEAAGHDVDLCTDEADAWEACEERTDLLVVEASSDSIDGATLVDSMRAGGELQGVRTLAFHGDADLRAKHRAEEVGFDVVVLRSQMQAGGAQLIAGLLALGWA
jgi:DNA-binding response OmpR family regulator